MATVVMPQLTSHRAIASKSSVNIENTRTGFSSRSGGTATKISLAPISIPPAFGSQSGRSSRHIPFRLRPRLLLLALPLLAWAFSSADFGGCFFGLDIHLIRIFSIIRGGAQKAAKGPSLGILHEFTQYEKDFSGHSPGIRLR